VVWGKRSRGSGLQIRGAFISWKKGQDHGCLSGFGNGRKDGEVDTGLLGSRKKTSVTELILPQGKPIGKQVKQNRTIVRENLFCEKEKVGGGQK